MRWSGLAWMVLCACNAAGDRAAASPRGSAPASEATRGPGVTATTAAGPIVLELFTSQGCSSCPPADDLLSEVGAAGQVADRPVVPLAFHVDYWDDLGWADPFASPRWSARQHGYARTLREARVYTPQLVVGGAAHLVGSDQRRLLAAVRAAAAPEPLRASARWTTEAVQIQVELSGSPTGELWAALWQDRLTTDVPRGENRGQRLRGDHVVRQLVAVREGTARIALEPGWRAGGPLGVVVFAQHGQGAITASAALPAPASP